MGNINFIEGLAFLGAFCGAVKYTTKDLVTALKNLKEALDKLEERYNDDQVKIAKDISNLNIKVTAIETDVHNHKGRLKVLEGLHKPRSVDDNA